MGFTGLSKMGKRRVGIMFLVAGLDKGLGMP